MDQATTDHVLTVVQLRAKGQISERGLQLHT